MDNPAPCPEILGRLLVIPSMLDVLVEKETIAKFLRAALREVPGVCDTRLSLEIDVYDGNESSEEDSNELSLKEAPARTENGKNLERKFYLETSRRRYGSLIIEVEDLILFNVYAPYIHNIANIIATVMENRVVMEQLLLANKNLQTALNRLEHIAYYDTLTNLPNRHLLNHKLHQSMINAQQEGLRIAVGYLDLDGFKAVNDTYGHAVGDQLLVTVATHMSKALREGDTLARLGGDEFVVVFAEINLPNSQAGKLIFNRLLHAASKPVLVDSHIIQVSASLGVTFYPQPDEIDADQLLRQADRAMYQAKITGKNRCHVFDAQLGNVANWSNSGGSGANT